MKTKILSAAILAAALATGTAMAQTNSSQNGSAPDGSMLNDQTKMAGFYTDESMSTLKSEDDIRANYDTMEAADQEQMKKECGQEDRISTEASKNIRDLCNIVSAY